MPTKSLYLLAYRAILQESFWANCLTRAESEIDINDWGWTVGLWTIDNISIKLTSIQYL